MVSSERLVAAMMRTSILIHRSAHAAEGAGLEHARQLDRMAG
jgi:hypothetical protein